MESLDGTIEFSSLSHSSTSVLNDYILFAAPVRPKRLFCVPRVNIESMSQPEGSGSLLAAEEGLTANPGATAISMGSGAPQPLPASTIAQRGSFDDSGPPSSFPSPAGSEASDELPNNVNRSSQLALLPPECLSGDKERPLRHVDEHDNECRYALRPMFYSVIFILLVELLERFSFYGINYTQTSYLTGAYDRNWNAHMEAISASSYVAISVAVAYTTPFLGAFLADSLLGDYWAILVGSICFYLPGLLLIAFTTIPGMLGTEFNRGALATGLLFLWPFGTGIVKSIVNVFGAKQFHPLLQSSLIEAYYVKFYMCINIGALIGGFMVPVVCQTNVTVAYFLPVGMLTMAISLFLMGTRRYVRTKPKNPLCGKRKRMHQLQSAEAVGLDVIIRISFLVIPFNIAYSQMATTFIVQGTVMEKAFGYVDAACMNNADAIAVLAFGYLVGSKIYPALAKRGIKIPTTYKFAFGSALGALAIAWALMVEHMIHSKYAKDGGKVSILWQAMAYILIGAGEIFAVSAAYEAAFTAAPPDKKVIASALNLFCIGGLPNIFCLGLYHACSGWFRNKHGTTNITLIGDYSEANIKKYFWLLFFIAILGVGMNLLPSVKEFVDGVEEQATDMIKTPKTPIRPPRKERFADFATEESPLVRAKRYQAYLKYGSEPKLYKSGSMRAGPSLSERPARKNKHMRKSQIGKLYDRNTSLSAPAGVVISSSGMPMKAGSVLRPIMDREDPTLHRADST